jgi:monofunctional biosynthetic peptidoglycan transglycosylase
LAQPAKPKQRNRRNVHSSARFNRPKRHWFREIVVAGILASISLYLLVGGLVLALRWVNPITTMVQIQRRIEAWRAHRPYQKRYEYVPMSRIATNLQHSVISAEDGRFFQHHGFDWVEMQKVLEDDLKNDRLGRGGSTITQQLVKNLFLTTERSLVRKAVEFTVVPIVEGLLTKRRILELYLNVIEWGPGIYGAQAAAEYYYHENASMLTRDQSARLAAIIPAPLKRKPAQMNRYTAEIENRMEKTGW